MAASAGIEIFFVIIASHNVFKVSSVNVVNVLRRRPISLGVIAFLMLWACVLAALELLAQGALATALHYTTLCGMIVNLVAAVAMLKRCNWGRLLYVGWNLAAGGIGLATAADKVALLPGLAAFAVLAFFLFRPNVNTYFRSLNAANDA
ncbi:MULTISPECIES: hypothetical protein [unclassified Janthinobacterium]|uniref:hypothetical protein n=1 Tax=unclassified Janthinobacterium TaxID=2610881 RepID=UPI0018CBE6F8|nr:hypothetical protein [Janthinobacterium sp. CG_23.4]MDH6158815.1 hypothetical protein [Janthinobacterium sp. CG_23.4]